MDLTPDVLRDIEFRRKGRGYETEDVDAFRRKVEVEVGEMQARLREATTKLEEAETRARASEDRAQTNFESDETIQRTLLLAQRTADAAIKEAEETASRKVGEAEAEAERLVTEARTHRERAISEAEAEVREAIDVKRAELLDELTTLERVRDSLSSDVEGLETHIEAQRARLRGVQTDLTQLLDHPDALGPVAAPILSGVEVPAPEPATPLIQPGPEPAFGEAEFAEPETVSADPWAGTRDEPQAAPVEPDPWAGPAGDLPQEHETVFGATPTEGDDDWSVGSEETWAAAPPPPPPPPPGLGVSEEAWADAPPPPPPPPPDFEAPTEAAAPENQPPAGFGGLPGPALPSLDDVADADNPWLSDLADQEAENEDGDRSRFGRRH